MKRSPRPLGVLLLCGGLLALLANTGMLGVFPAFVWVVVLFFAGAGVWLAPNLRRGQRVLAYLALGGVATVTSGVFAGTAATGFVALAFVLAYLKRPDRWLYLIPAGVLVSVTLLIATETLFPRWNGVPVFFLGLAATFTYLYLLPPERGGKRWALYPAIFWILLTVAVNDPSGRHGGLMLPILLIGGGVLLLWWWRGSTAEGKLGIDERNQRKK